MKMSLKYKILGIMILLPALALLVFAYMASEMFLNDKMAYIYETSFKHNSSLANNTKYKFDKFSTFLKFNIQNLKTSQQLPSTESLKLEPSLIGMRVFKQFKGKLNLVTKFSRVQDYDFVVNLKQYQDKYNQLTDEPKIDFQNSTDSSLRIFVRDSSSGLLIEGIFELADLAQSYKNDKLFYNVLIFPAKLVFSNNTNKVNVKRIFSTIKSNKNTKGVFEAIEENSIVSFSEILPGTWVISVLDKNKALSVLDNLKIKSILFIFAIISLSIILSVFASRKLTGNLSILTVAAEEIGKGDFSTQVDIRSNDEVGILADSFNNMSSQIASLLSELEEYNRTLEQKVEERTFELKQAMDMQNTILDSVDQGFVLVNKDLSILPVYSKASVNLFDGVPDEKRLSDLLHLEGSQASEIETYFSMAVEEMMPFNDMMLTAPAHFLNKTHREVFLQYMPVRDERKKVDKIVLVATDKTDEIEALKRLELQKAKVEMVLKIASNAKAFISFEAQTLKYVNTMTELLSSAGPLEKDYIARIVHTIKGNAAVYSLKNIVELSHDFEEGMKSHSLDPKNLSQYLQNILYYLDEISQEYSAIIRPGGENEEEGLTLLGHELDKIKMMLDQDEAKERVKSFFEFLSDSEVLAQKLSVLSNEAVAMSERLDKKVNVEVKGKDVRVPQERFDELFSNMIHLVRNAMDHGIEKSTNRKERGKSEVAKLLIKASVFEGKELIIEVQDDGQGINVEKVAQKLKENGIDTSDISEEQMPYMIFHDGISTSDEITDVSGRGVGVSSVKEVVDSMGGQIIIETKLGQGTTFIIKVPLFESNENLEVLNVA